MCQNSQAILQRIRKYSASSGDEAQEKKNIIRIFNRNIKIINLFLKYMKNALTNKNSGDIIKPSKRDKENRSQEDIYLRE